MSATSIPFVTTGSYPARRGNLVQPWIDGEPAFRRICAAIAAAEQRVWATITFMWPAFRMPDGLGTALDVLECAAQRGLDVRLIFWRPDEVTARHRQNAFWGSPAHFALLAEHYSHLKIRWDRAHPGYCQHQKSWLIDPSGATATAFVGGINLNPHSVVAPGHQGQGHNHDVYIEIAGPAVADVEHNFVQRWNEASERTCADGWWGPGSDEDLPFPTHTPPECGTVLMQIQRTIHAGRYRHTQPTPHGVAFPIAAGEQSNLDQYCLAIRSARRTIYLENQYVEVAEIVAALHEALARGVLVALLLPAVPDITPTAVVSPDRLAFLAERARLATYENFTLCGIAGLDDEGRRQPVYVHSKLMLIDDEWATVGSCNLHHYSLFGNSELNAAFFDPATVHAMRVALFQEYLAVDTAAMADRSALRLLRQIADENRQRHVDNDPNWQGLAFRLTMATYGQVPQF
ncbi:MAG: phosphatidylserine/phosphatidylglycerophosphate/cardiolipin synthase family protein [Caldilineaceae bacterium]|nr:phosphatidylserine/phosphatidylglycerophosphate/cardiolipin synthase family protein [Caldilineaceae bacterium]